MSKQRAATQVQFQKQYVTERRLVFYIKGRAWVRIVKLRALSFLTNVPRKVEDDVFVIVLFEAETLINS